MYSGIFKKEGKIEAFLTTKFICLFAARVHVGLSCNELSSGVLIGI